MVHHLGPKSVYVEVERVSTKHHKKLIKPDKKDNDREKLVRLTKSLRERCCTQSFQITITQSKNEPCD